MTTFLALVVCFSVCLAQTTFGRKVLSPMESIQKRSVSIVGEEITIVPMSGAILWAQHFTFSFTKCGENGVSYAILSAPNDKTKNWTQVNDTVTKTMRIPVAKGFYGPKELMVYLALKHSTSVEKDTQSFVVVQMMGVYPRGMRPTPLFSVPNSKVQLQWNAKAKTVNVIFPRLHQNKWVTEYLFKRSSDKYLVVSYRMIATSTEKFTTDMAKCGSAMATGKTVLIDMGQPFYSQGTVSFEFKPTEPVYYITLVASVANTHWSDISTKLWEISYDYPVTKYEVPAEYIQQNN